MLALWKKSCDQRRQHIKTQRYDSADNGPSSQSYGFSSSHLRMWKLEHKESWELKNWCFWAVVLERTLESPLDYKIKPVNPQGNRSWIFIGRADAEAEAPCFGHLMWRTLSLEKTVMLGKIEGRRRRQRMRWLDGLMDMSLSKLWELVMDREAWHDAFHEVSKSWTWLIDWTELRPKRWAPWLPLISYSPKRWAPWLPLISYSLQWPPPIFSHLHM